MCVRGCTCAYVWRDGGAGANKFPIQIWTYQQLQFGVTVNGLFLGFFSGTFALMYLSLPYGRSLPALVRKSIVWCAYCCVVNFCSFEQFHSIWIPPGYYLFSKFFVSLIKIIVNFPFCSFGSLMTATLQWEGIPTYIIGIARGVSATIGITATFLYPILQSRISTLRTGLWSIWSQVCSDAKN